MTNSSFHTIDKEKELQETVDKLIKAMEWISVKDRLPEKEGWYTTVRTVFDSPQTTMFLKHDGFGDNNRVGLWVEIPPLPAHPLQIYRRLM